MADILTNQDSEQVILALRQELAKEEMALDACKRDAIRNREQTEVLLKQQQAIKQKMISEFELQLAAGSARIADVEQSYALLETKVKELESGIQANQEKHKTALIFKANALEALAREKAEALQAVQEAIAKRQEAEAKVAELRRKLADFIEMRKEETRKEIEELEESIQASDRAIQTMPAIMPWIRSFDEHKRKYRKESRKKSSQSDTTAQLSEGRDLPQDDQKETGQPQHKF